METNDATQTHINGHIHEMIQGQSGFSGCIKLHHYVKNVVYMGRSRASPQGFVCKFYRKQFLHARQPAIKIPFKPGTQHHCLQSLPLVYARPHARRPPACLVALLFFWCYLTFIHFLGRNNAFDIHVLKVFYIPFLNIPYQKV